MVIESLTLSNFRLYKKKSFSFSPSVTIVIGPNASGKTNLLEAVFLLATGKSFKAEKDREMISFEEELARVEGVVNQLSNYPINTNKYQSTNEKIELEVVVTTGQVMGVKTPIKKYLINGVGKRMLDFVGRFKVVLFWPEDLELVTDSPSLRRRYLDFVLTQVDREYRRTLISYEKGLRQRNKILEGIRDKERNRNQLIFWDQLLIKNGEYITKKREEYIDYINSCRLWVVGCRLDRYRLEYDKSVISKTRLEQYSEEEVVVGMTLVGPHRDDVIFKIKNQPFDFGTYQTVHPFAQGKNSKVKAKDTPPGGGVEELRDLSHFGSRGEQRLAILWLKLGELAFIEEKTGEKPVLLLDDILSELDHECRKIIFDIIDNQQTIITTTDEHFLDKSLTPKNSYPATAGSESTGRELLKIIKL